ncbi:MAG TPA: hypothetical protein DDW52_27060 [Planctomycetaceae bacterium]|nr:hypothetical protein [Planctomycetaceae bacterium]
MADGNDSQIDAFFQDVLAQKRDDLIALASSILRDRHEAEDIVQETVAATWQRLPKIAPERIEHYLIRAVRQNAIKRKTRRRVITNSDGFDAIEVHKASADDPIELEEAIESLPLSQQTIIRMKYYFGMTFRQIGDALSISSHTAASRARYAVDKLRKKLKSREHNND